MIGKFCHILCVLCVAVSAAGGPTSTTRPTGRDDQPFLLHLPGIGGHRAPDQWLTEGLAQAGLGAETFIYDWTGEDEGLNALTNFHRHEAHSKWVADFITELKRKQPNRRIILSSHSGGCGIAAWALEQLPADVTIDTWLLLAPALSPEYDLSRALRRIDGEALAFNSDRDPVLGFGTRNFGTIDRVKTDAAGRVGFVPPATADAGQYAKLRQFGYRSEWVWLGNAGDHVGCTVRPFARRIIGPLLLTGQMPTVRPPPNQAVNRPTTRPTTAPTPAG